jgi:hypothetical protein
MPACPLHHPKACPKGHRAKSGRDTVGLQKRGERTLCLSLGTGIASSFASSDILRTRMRQAAFEPDARACGWAIRGMRSAVLLPWRRRGGAVGASGLRCRCRFLFVSAMSKRQTSHRSNWATRCARLRAIATVDPTGHAHRGQLSQQSDKMERRVLSGPKPVRRILHEMANMDASATDGARVRGVGLGDSADSFGPWWSHRSVSRQIQSDSTLRAARHRRWHVQFGLHAVARQCTSRQNLFHRAGEFGFPLGVAV